MFKNDTSKRDRQVRRSVFLGILTCLYLGEMGRPFAFFSAPFAFFSAPFAFLSAPFAFLSAPFAFLSAPFAFLSAPFAFFPVPTYSLPGECLFSKESEF